MQEKDSGEEEMSTLPLPSISSAIAAPAMQHTFDESLFGDSQNAPIYFDEAEHKHVNPPQYNGSEMREALTSMVHQEVHPPMLIAPPIDDVTSNEELDIPITQYD